MNPIKVIKSFLLIITLLLVGCVDQIDSNQLGNIDILVVDGMITNWQEEQIVRINLSKSDPITGRYGSTPATKAVVEILVNAPQNASQLLPLTETVPGTYQVPIDFVGKVGNSYQLRIQLANGKMYESTPQVMPFSPPIDHVTATFNPTSLTGDIKAAHDIFLDTKDPVDQHNYYRWDWNLYEQQDWCRSCEEGVYAVNNILPGQYHFGQYVSGDQLYEDCFAQPPEIFNSHDSQAPFYQKDPWVYDYRCRTKCWEIIRNLTMNLFDDQNTNGGQILGRRVAQIPFFQRSGCLVQIRQLSITKEAYGFYKIFQQQVQNGGGVADTPPTALIGNVYNVANKHEVVVGFFTATAISTINYWIDRKDTKNEIPPGLFEGLNHRDPTEEPEPPYGVPKMLIWGGPLRVPTAVCTKTYTRTPFKPDGWLGN